MFFSLLDTFAVIEAEPFPLWGRDLSRVLKETSRSR